MSMQNDKSKQYVSGESIDGEFLVHKVFGGAGKSGMGVVYLVTSRNYPEPFVIKTSQASNDSFFFKEAKAWVNVGSHPNIVKALWVDKIGTDNPLMYVAAEYISGDEQRRNTVEQFLSGRPLPLDQSIKWAAQFCYGMKHAVQHGVPCHRDIKPANLMVDYAGDLKITDFGLAKINYGSDELQLDKNSLIKGAPLVTGKGAVMGTKEYMSPEQFINAAGTDIRADIYSFGIVLFQFATGGNRPFNPPANAVNRFIDYRMAQVNFPVPKIESPLKHIIERCLKKERNERYQSLDEMLEDIAFLAKTHKVNVLAPSHSIVDHLDSLYSKSMSLSELGDVDEAMAAISEYVRLRPEAGCGWTQMGKLMLLRGDLEKSIECSKKSIGYDSDNSHSWNNMGVAYNRMGQYEQAVICFEKALEIDPINTGSMNNLAMAYKNLKRYDESCKILLNAVCIKPEKEEYRINLGNTIAFMIQNHGTFLSNEQHQSFWLRAKEILKVLTELEPNNAVYWTNLGIANQMLDNLDGVIDSFINVERLEPNNGHALLRLAEAYWYSENFRQAILYSNRLLARNENVLRALSIRGRAMTASGRYPQAVELLARAFRQHPYSDAILVILADLHEISDNYDEAIRALEHCEQLLLMQGSRMNRNNLNDVKERIAKLRLKL